MTNEIGLNIHVVDVKKVHTFHWKLAPIIGFGYWKDVYDYEKLGLGGEVNNLIILCLRFQWGFLLVPES